MLRPLTTLISKMFVRNMMLGDQYRHCRAMRACGWDLSACQRDRAEKDMLGLRPSFLLRQEMPLTYAGPGSDVSDDGRAGMSVGERLSDALEFVPDWLRPLALGAYWYQRHCST
jgi:hypothetical protein